MRWRCSHPVKGFGSSTTIEGIERVDTEGEEGTDLPTVYTNSWKLLVVNSNDMRLVFQMENVSYQSIKKKSWLL